MTQLNETETSRAPLVICHFCKFAADHNPCRGCRAQMKRLRLTPQRFDAITKGPHTDALLLARAIEIGLLPKATQDDIDKYHAWLQKPAGTPAPVYGDAR